MTQAFRSVSWTLLATLALAISLPASPQGGKKAPAKDHPEVAGLIKSLATVVRAKAARDGEGEQILDKLSSLYSSLNGKQQKLVVKAVNGVFKAKRKPNEVTMLLSAGEALSRFGKPGAEGLAKAIKNRRWKNKKEWSAFRSQLVRLLGRPAEKKFSETLLDIALKDNDDQARAKAGEALGDYAKFSQKLRKRVVERLVNHLEQVYSNAESTLDPNDLNAKVWKDRYAAIQDPWMRTLKKHTGQNFKNVQGWRTWLNKNKKKNWDKGRAPSR